MINKTHIINIGNQMNIGALKIPKKTNQTITPIIIKNQTIVITFAPIDGLTLKVISSPPKISLNLIQANSKVRILCKL